jgi:hypothetical protein
MDNVILSVISNLVPTENLSKDGGREHHSACYSFEPASLLMDCGDLG